METDGSPIAAIGGYTIERRLEHGRLGVAYVARRGGIEREVVLRVLPIEPGYGAIASSEEFRSHARVLTVLSHCWLVGIREVLVTDDGLVVAEEAVWAETLSDVLQREGSLPWAVVRPIAAQVLATLEFLHGRDLLHLAVKPRNVFVLDGCSSVKLVDGGLPYLLRLVAPGHWAQLAGQPHWAPELASGAEPGPSADIYAAGVLLRTLLAGLPEESAPPGGDERFDLLEIATDAPPPDVPAMPLAEVPGVPPEVVATVAACLAPDPMDRPLSIRDVRARLGFVQHADPAARAHVASVLQALAAEQVRNLGYASTPSFGQSACPACGRPLRPRAPSCLACGYAVPAEPVVARPDVQAPLLEVGDEAPAAPSVLSPGDDPHADGGLRTGSIRVDFFVAQGDHLASQGRWEEALGSYRSAAGHESASGVAYNRMGDALTVLRRHGEARAAYERAAELNPGDWDARHDLGRVLLTLGLPREAAAHLRAVAAAETLPELRLSALTHLGSALVREARLAEALAAWRQVVIEGPPNAPVLYAMGMAYARLGEREYAATCWRQALHADPNHAESRVALSQAAVPDSQGPYAAGTLSDGASQSQQMLDSALDFLGSLLRPFR